MSQDNQGPDEIAPLAEQICRNHAIQYKVISRILEGGHSTFKVDDRHIIKIFTMRASLEYSMRKESQILQSLARHTSVPVPIVEATGVLGELNYMILSVVPGEPLHRVLERLSDENRRYLLADVGHVLRQFHDHRPHARECPDFDDIDCTASDWWNFLESRKQFVLKMMDSSGHEWAETFSDFVDRTLITMEPRLVLLHADLQSAHIIVTEADGRWGVSGVIDVTKVSMGTPEYDWANLPDCIGWERASLLPIVLSAYGCAHEIDEHFANRLLVNYLFQRPRNSLLNLSNRIMKDIEPGDYTELAKRLFRPIGRQTGWRSQFY